MDDQVKLSVTAPPVSHGASNILDFGLPFPSHPTQNRRRPASVPGKERKIRVDADHRDKKLNRNVLQKQGNECQRFLRKCSNCIENKHDMEELLDTSSTCFQRVVSPYFQKVVAVGSEEVVDGYKKDHTKKRSIKDKWSKDKNKHRQKSNGDCLVVENGNTDVHLKGYRIVSPYFQAKLASDGGSLELKKERKKKEEEEKEVMEVDEPLGEKRSMEKIKCRRKRDEGCLIVENGDVSLGHQKEKAKKEKKRKKSKRREDDELLGVQCCGSISHRVSPYFKNINKAARILQNSSKKFKDEAISGSLCNNEISITAGCQGKDKIQGASVNDMESLLPESEHLKLDFLVHSEPEISSAANTVTEIPVKSRNIQLDEHFAKFAYKGGVNITDKDDLKKETKMKRTCRARTNLSASEKKAEAYKRTSLDNPWKPPVSTYKLLQEKYFHDPWKVLVICILLNTTTGLQVKRILRHFFSMCPDAETTIRTETFEIDRVIQSLGLQHKRAAIIQRFSKEYLSDEWTHVTELHGIGKYAADAYAIFCNGMWNQVKPNDHKLYSYWKFLKARSIKLDSYVNFILTCYHGVYLEMHYMIVPLK